MIGKILWQTGIGVFYTESSIKSSVCSELTEEKKRKQTQKFRKINKGRRRCHTQAILSYFVVTVSTKDVTRIESIYLSIYPSIYLYLSKYRFIDTYIHVYIHTWSKGFQCSTLYWNVFLCASAGSRAAGFTLKHCRLITSKDNVRTVENLDSVCVCAYPCMCVCVWV